MKQRILICYQGDIAHNLSAKIVIFHKRQAYFVTKWQQEICIKKAVLSYKAQP